jgi:hypothetical protein
MAAYSKDTVDFWPQSARSAAPAGSVAAGAAMKSDGFSSSNMLNSADIRQLAVAAPAEFGKGGCRSADPSTCEQIFGRNIVMADARAECRVTNRDHPQIMQHVPGDSA